MTIQSAINEWSCALACVTSLANDFGIVIDQVEIINRFSKHFPEWEFRKGLLTRMEILRLLELLGITSSYVLLTPDRTEFLSAFTKNYSAYLGSFIISHHPTNHCWRILGCTGDIVDLMEPHPTNAYKMQHPWSFLDDKQPEYLLLCS